MEKHLIKIKEQIGYAQNKHRHFADHFKSTFWTNADVEAHLANERKMYEDERIKGHSFQNIIAEEIFEAIDAYDKKDYENAYHELAQCGAVICRAMDMVYNKHLKENNDGNAV